MSLLKEDKEIWDQAYKEGDLTDDEYRKEVGEEPPVLSKKEEKPSEEESSKKKEEESKEEKSKVKPSKEESNEEKKTEEERSEEHKEKEKEKVKEEEEEFTRTPMIPLSKHKKLKEKYRELKKDVESGKKTKEEAKEEIDEELNKYAEDNKLDGKQLTRLVDIIKKQVGVPEKKVDDKETKKIELDNRLAKEEVGYNKDFDKSVLPILAKKYPDMTAIQEKKVRNMFHELAFTEELATTPLRLIYYGNIKKIKDILVVSKKKSAEGSRGTGSKSESSKLGKLPLDREPTEEELDNASDKEFDAWNEKMEKKSNRLKVTNMDGNEVK